MLQNAQLFWSAISEHSRLTSSYVPFTATTLAPYTNALRIFDCSVSQGRKTYVFRPTRIPAAATALARLPVEAQAKVSKPNSRALAEATATTRSLNEKV